MLICPKCKSEYREGYTICSDCKCDLVEITEITEATEAGIPVKSGAKIIQFIIGILLILCSPILSYKFTSMYFIPNGSGQYNNDQFVWMLKAFHYSFLFVGGLISVPYVFYRNKNYKD